MAAPRLGSWQGAVFACALGGLLLGAAGLGAAGAARPDKGPSKVVLAQMLLEATEQIDSAAMLIADGEVERASLILDQVDTTVPGLDLTRFHRFRGIVRLQLGAYHSAAEDLAEAVKDPEVDAFLFVLLAQAHLKDGAPTEARAALDSAGEAGDKLAGTWLLRARIADALKDDMGAWEALDQGAWRFPDDVTFVNNQVAMLVRLGLYQEAMVRGRTLLDRPDAGPEEVLVLAEALRRAGEHASAARILEEGRLRYPEDNALTVSLGFAYLAADMPLAAGELFQRAAELDPASAVDAAEAFRRAGLIQRALYANTLVPDAAEKARQRLGLLMEAQDFERAVALQPRMARLDLLEEDALTYALAYSWFQLDDYARSEQLLKRLKDPKYFEYANVLRTEMQACAAVAGGCR